MTPSNLRTGRIVQPAPPVRLDAWEEEITPGQVAGMVVAAIFVIVGLIVGLGFLIVALTPAP